MSRGYAATLFELAYVPVLYAPNTWKLPVDSAQNVRRAIRSFEKTQIPMVDRDYVRQRIADAAVAFGIVKPGDYICALRCQARMVPTSEEDMQLALAGTVNQGDDGTIIMYVAEGGAGFRVPVVREPSGNYSCQALQCIYKRQSTFCEHVQFAREQHDTVLAPAEEVKAKAQLEMAQMNLERARELVSKLEQNVPSAQPVALPQGPRRIVLPDENS